MVQSEVHITVQQLTLVGAVVDLGLEADRAVGAAAGRELGDVLVVGAAGGVETGHGHMR